MKTTIEISTPIFKRAKKYAQEHHITLKTLIESGLQIILSGKSPQNGFTMPDCSVSGKGLQSGFNWDDWTSIRHAIYGRREESDDRS